MSAPLLFVHGWGQSRQAWHRQMQAFPDAEFLNLPGHGGAPEAADWVATLAAQLPDAPVHLVGWSLGGMLAMQLALASPERVAALTLVSTTPRFRSGEGWAFGSSDAVFDGFEQGLLVNSAKTMSRFFALMLHGDALSRSDYNAIARGAVDKGAPPSEVALKRGLDYLAGIDLVDSISRIQQPALVMHGDADAVVPPAAGRWLVEHLPAAELHRFNACGHAPFLSQPEHFNEILEAWCHSN